MLVTAVLIVLGIRPPVGAMVGRLLLCPEHAVLGKLAWGPVDYAIFYRHFMIIVAEVTFKLHATFADPRVWDGLAVLFHITSTCAAGKAGRP